MLRVRVRYSQHRHTGRLRPHRETSYAMCLFLVLGLGVFLLSLSFGATAGTDPIKGSYDITATVTGPRPSTPATITSPTNGQSFTTNPITIAGSCPAKTLIKVFTNGILIGSAICDPTNHFSLQADLVTGSNSITVLPFNTLDQPGPDSPPVIVSLAFPAGGLGFSQQLLLQSTSYYRGALPGDTVTWPITIVGGVSPYAVNFDWGDGTSDLVTRLTAGPFNLNHIYKKNGGYLGSYPLVIRATDSAGNSAFLQLTSIINDPTGNVVLSSKVKTPTSRLIVMWPLWIILLVMVISFWLGERREKRVMLRRMAALA